MNTSSEISTQREGLPASYQMRADAHYVDLLDHVESGPTLRFLPAARFSAEPRPEVAQAFVESVRTHGILQPLVVRRDGGEYRLIDGRKRLAAALAAGTSSVPCLVHHIDAEAAGAIEEALRVAPADPAAAGPPIDDASESMKSAVARGARALVRSIHQLGGCANLLENADLTQRTLVDIVRVEAARSWCLATMLAVADGSGSNDFATSPYPARRLIERIATLCDPARRLRLAVLDSKLALRDSTQLLINADVTIAVCAGLVLAAFEASAERTSPRIEVALESRGSDGCFISIAAPRSIEIAEASPFGSAMLAGAATAAALHGGRFTTSLRESGVVYSINVPIAT